MNPQKFSLVGYRGAGISVKKAALLPAMPVVTGGVKIEGAPGTKFSLNNPQQKGGATSPALSPLFVCPQSALSDWKTGDASAFSHPFLTPAMPPSHEEMGGGAKCEFG